MRAIHVISTFSATVGGVLGQLKTAEKRKKSNEITKNSRKKSNEITAISELINLLDIKGKIITTDGMGCQKDIAEKIVSLEGDYLFAVK
ncbi:Transposase [Salmonella enterica subsp. enterica serovar Baildon str. R6-199]|nr:Transposase [Salmonella enterica subsp. enterica serovar Baildon str. R6-199]